jgi:hypothetical protein
MAVPTDGMSDDYCAGYLVGATDGDGTMREREDGKEYRERQWYRRVAVTSRQLSGLGFSSRRNRLTVEPVRT